MPAGLLRAGIVVPAPESVRPYFGNGQVRDMRATSMFGSVVRATRGGTKHACASPGTTFEIAAGRIASVRDGDRGVEKVCAVSAQIDLCGAGTGCRSSAVRECRNSGCPTTSTSSSHADAKRCRARCANASRKKCLYLSALRKHIARARCIRGRSAARRRCRGRRSPPDEPELHPEKICAGLLTCRKTVIRFRPADDSCGTM